jgi:hypothetical protein
MTDKPKSFVEATFKGPRFTRPELPVDVLPELLAYKDLVVRVAKELYRARHGRSRVPKGFDASFQLVLQEIREGSAIAALRRADFELPLEATQEESGEWDAFEEAKNKVEDYVAAIGSYGEAPADFPENVIPMFREFGKRLRDDEEILFPSPRHKEPVRYNQQVRKRIVLQISNTYEKDVELVGPIVKLDKEHAHFRIRTDDYGSIDIPYTPVQGAMLATALRDGEFTKVSVLAAAQFDRDEHIKSVQVQDVSITGILSEDQITRIERRLDEFTKLEPGWSSGYGEAPSRDATEWVRGVLLGLMAKDELPPPYLYATDAGHIRAEWTFGRWEVSAEFKLSGASVSLEAVDPGTGDYRDGHVVFAGALDEDLAISTFVKDLQAEGTAK